MKEFFNKFDFKSDFLLKSLDNQERSKVESLFETINFKLSFISSVKPERLFG